MKSLLKIVALVVLISTPALFATAITLTADDPNTAYDWTNAITPPALPEQPYCTLDPIITWNLGSVDSVKGLSFKMEGDVPASDPLFTQTITNNTQQIWKDWHVDILNGSIDTVLVYKKTSTGVRVGPDWMYQIGIHNDGFDNGFGAGYNNNSALEVANGEKLFVQFRWTASPPPAGTPQISQYPTYDGNFIPEPCTIGFLTFGLVAFGLKSPKTS